MTGKYNEKERKFVFKTYEENPGEDDAYAILFLERDDKIVFRNYNFEEGKKQLYLKMAFIKKK